MTSLNELLGPDKSPILAFLLIFAVAVVLLLIIVWAIRKLIGGNRLPGGRSRQPRLAVTEAAIVDDKRRLVLIRRDNVEHLMMIGGPNDLVIEKEIIRVRPANQPLIQNATMNPVPDDRASAMEAPATGGGVAGFASALKGSAGKFAGGVTDGIGTVAGTARDAGSAVARTGANAAKTTVQKVGETGSTVADTAQRAGSAALQSGAQAIGTVRDGALQAGDKAANAVAATAGAVAATADGVTTTAANAVTATAGAVAATAGTVVAAGHSAAATVSSTAQGAATGLRETKLGETMEAAAQKVVSTTANTVGNVGERVQSAGATTVQAARNGLHVNEIADLEQSLEDELQAGELTASAGHRANSGTGNAAASGEALLSVDDLEDALVGDLALNVPKSAETGKPEDEDELQRMLAELAGKR